MAGMTLDDFEKEVLLACLQSPIVASIAVNGAGVTWLRLRAHLVDGSFIEVYYNEVTGRIAYALIKEQQRILGADNTGDWHWHPVDEPDAHLPVLAPVTFKEFLGGVSALFQP